MNNAGLIDIDIYYIETIMPYYVIKKGVCSINKSLLLVIVQQCIWFLSQLKARKREKIKLPIHYKSNVFLNSKVVNVF